MEWLIVIGLIVLFTLRKLHRRPKEYEIKGMSAQDIGRIADQMWKEWKGE